ncbi:MAG: glycosyltransferase family 2 protein [Candidatus Eisenbacteria bacterium]|nr:glycosyltransferase family 2 protein [Candidatus Eisenbacteria bacterium]
MTPPTLPVSPSGPTPVVSVVIATYNRRPKLERVLAHLLQQTLPADQAEILIVDNSSTDDTGAWVASLPPGRQPALRYFVKDPNGPGSARNFGARHSRGEFVVFLDSDVLLDSQWLARAVGQLRGDPSLGLLGGKLLYAFAPDRVNAFGGVTGWIGLSWDAHEGEPDRGLDRPRDCLWVNSSAMIARRELFLEVGGFDETFFYGYEEADLGWRINLAGSRVGCSPDLVAHHDVDPATGTSDRQVVYHYCKNRLRTLIRNSSPGRLLACLPAYALYSIADLALRGPRGPKLAALRWNLASLPDTLRLRAGTQARRRAAPGAVERLISPRWFPAVPLNNQRRRPVPGFDAGAGAAGTGPGAADDRVGSPPGPATGA